MKIGVIISMYDEIDIVKNTVNVVKQNKCPIIVIQSDPQQSEKLLESEQVDFYEKLSDLAGSKKEYLKLMKYEQKLKQSVEEYHQTNQELVFKHGFHIRTKFCLF